MKKNSDYFRRIHAVLFEKKTAQGSILKHVDRLLSKSEEGDSLQGIMGLL